MRGRAAPPRGRRGCVRAVQLLLRRADGVDLGVDLRLEARDVIVRLGEFPLRGVPVSPRKLSLLEEAVALQAVQR